MLELDQQTMGQDDLHIGWLDLTVQSSETINIVNIECGGNGKRKDAHPNSMYRHYLYQ